MGKAAAKRKTTTTPADDELDQYLTSFAKRQFFGAVSNLSWRLSATVVIPIVGGVKLDEHFGTSPSYTLGGLMLAAIAGSAAVWATVKEVNAEQAEEFDKKSSRKSKENQ